MLQLVGQAACCVQGHTWKFTCWPILLQRRICCQYQIAPFTMIYPYSSQSVPGEQYGSSNKTKRNRYDTQYWQQSTHKLWSFAGYRATFGEFAQAHPNPKSKEKTEVLVITRCDYEMYASAL